MLRSLAFVGAFALVAGVAYWRLTEPVPFVSPAVAATLEPSGDAARGRIVFDAGGCASCHVSQGQPEDHVDRLKLGGGLELKSPYGSFFAPNISPDPDDGIGRWTAADLVNALKAGVSPDGRHYFPAFPYTTYAHARVEDIRDLWAFLLALAPVKGRAPAHRIAFPFNVRRNLGIWKTLYLDRSPILDDPTRSGAWNRGRYLVMALGHCAECHSPRNALGGLDRDQLFAGGPDLEGRGWVPNITQNKDALGSWSEKDIVEVLTSGETPDYDSVGSSMVAVVANTSQLPREDRVAMAAFIKSLPSRESPPRPKAKDAGN